MKKAKYRIRATPGGLYTYILEVRVLWCTWRKTAVADSKEYLEQLLKDQKVASFYDAKGNKL